MKKFRNIFGRIIGGALLSLVLLAQPAAGIWAQANFDATLLVTKGEDEKITDDDRAVAYAFIVDKMNTLKTLYDLSPEGTKRMNEVFYEANVFIANTDLTVAQLVSYMTEVEANLEAAAKTNVKGANQFLYLTNNTVVPTASYSQVTTVNLSVVNLGETLLQDVIITPVMDTDIKKWPFVISTAESVRKIYRLEPVDDPNQSAQFAQTVSWNFQVSADALSGTYPLTFHAKYYRDGEIEETDLKSFISIKGAPGSGSLGESGGDMEKTSTPRIIVTGFKTDPEKVFAGDTFHLTITVQNTARNTAVSNIQFDLKAAKEGSGDNVVEAFLPTSGSATIFVDTIPAGGTKDLEIEMSARSDLTQKPYVVDVAAAYEDDKNNAFTASTSVSIPIYQEARVDTGDAEVLPPSMEVGNSSNIMFPIYNKGKTTLYNVSVEISGDSIQTASAFIGKMDPGASGNVDTMVTGIAPTVDDGTIMAVVSYEDEAGNVSTLEKPLSLYVYEPSYEDPGMYEDMGDMEEEARPFPWWLVISGVVAAVVIGVIVAVVLSKAKKKKQRQQELDELDDDDEIKDLDDEE